jgi:multidrug efflux system outer membrane protein
MLRSLTRILPAALLTMALCALLSDCSLEPRYHQPPLPVPDQWPIPDTTAPSESTPATVAASAEPVTQIGWRDFFIDPRLQQLIALALANNRDLRVAVLNVELARAQYHVQRAAQLPAIDGSGSYTREKLPPALSFGIPAYTEQYYEAAVGISNFEIDLFGRVRSLSRVALQQYLAQGEARRSAQLSLIAQIASAYLSLAADRELQQLAHDTLESQQKSFDLIRRQHEIGSASGLDLAQAQTTVESARADAARYEGNVAQDLDALTLLVGTPVDSTLLPDQFQTHVVGLSALPSDLPSTVLLRRPDVLQAEHLLRSNNANIGAARAAFFPTISLTASYGFASIALSDLFKKSSSTWLVEPQATLPIFEGGKLIGNLAAARANRDIALAQYEKAIQSSFREVADALALTATLQRERTAEEALVAATGRAYELSQQRYKSGTDSFLNVLDSQRSNYSAQQSLITIRLAEQSNRVTLYKALGGGWQERSTPGRQP